MAPSRGVGPLSVETTHDLLLVLDGKVCMLAPGTVTPPHIHDASGSAEARGVASAPPSNYLFVDLDADVEGPLQQAWREAQGAWESAAAHDKLLAVARSQNGYVWLASRYRKRAERGDEIAQQRLARVKRVVELSVLFARPEREEPTPYRSLTRMLMMLAILFAIGFAFMKQAMLTSHAGPAQPRTSQKGSAMLVVMIILAALMAGAATLTSVTASASRSATTTNMMKASLACAESGLVAARAHVKANWASWNTALAAGTEPAFLSSVSRDLDGDSVADFAVTLEDNVDETGTNDPTKDNDLTVFVVSRCTKYTDTPVKVAELVRYNGGGNCYQAQLGGCGGNNNAN